MTEEEEARRRLGEEGFGVAVERKETPSEGVPAGEVAAQDPPAGEKTKRGTEVDLTVSSGPPKQGGTDRGGVPPAGGGAPSGDQYR